jgi:hypothetical protein
MPVNSDQVYETMTRMSHLMAYSAQHENLTASQAMTSWLQSTANNPILQQQNAGQGGNVPPSAQMMQQGLQHPQGNLPPGARTPLQNGQLGGPPPNHQFMSPAMANQLLPNAVMNGSPHLMQQNHTPSPASHAMAAQLSQQGSSTTASVNTSPNVSNKRRRSTAKGDIDDGVEVNGAQKVKQSPRIGGNKRAKANN